MFPDIYNIYLILIEDFFAYELRLIIKKTTSPQDFQRRQALADLRIEEAR
jgi:hypothetical protein